MRRSVRPSGDAACAELSDAVVWHYDEDYDRIADATGQRTAWVAPKGSL